LGRAVAREDAEPCGVSLKGLMRTSGALFTIPTERPS
jgi:hypothetical protein